jgi:hypothetical protein
MNLEGVPRSASLKWSFTAALLCRAGAPARLGDQSWPTVAQRAPDCAPLAAARVTYRYGTLTWSLSSPTQTGPYCPAIRWLKPERSRWWRTCRIILPSGMFQSHHMDQPMILRRLRNLLRRAEDPPSRKLMKMSLIAGFCEIVPRFGETGRTPARSWRQRMALAHGGQEARSRTQRKPMLSFL